MLYRQLPYRRLCGLKSSQKWTSSLAWKEASRPPISSRHLQTGQQPPSKREPKRVHVVNEELCRDALNLLEPSLRKHRGCTIFDLFPGNGLWSRMVHELVKPRAHILLENRDEVQESLLSPLLDQVNSRFQLHLIDHDSHLDPAKLYNNLVAETELLTTSPSNQNDEPNDDILVLASLTSLSKSKFPQRKIRTQKNKVTNDRSLTEPFVNDARKTKLTKDRSPAEPFVYKFLQQLQTRTGFHSSGPVRLLFWTLDRDKFHFLPKNVIGRKFTSLTVEEASFPREIVGCAEPPRGVRPAQIELDSAIRTARRMDASGITLPIKRQAHAHKSVLKNTSMGLSGKNDNNGSASDLPALLSELRDLEIKWAFDAFPRYVELTNGPDKRHKENTTEFTRMKALRASLNSLVGEAYDTELKGLPDRAIRTLTVKALLHQLERTIALEKSQDSKMQNASATDREDALQRLNDRIADMSRLLDERRKATVERISDDGESLYRDQPLLCWDRRPFEPLESSPDDFYPPPNLALYGEQSLALLDLQPRKPHPEGFITSLPLVRRIATFGSKPLTEMLDSVAPGAAEALVPACTLISDPLQGGRLNPQDLRVRMLTLDMWRQLVHAWNRWPFKKSDEELITQ